MLGDQPREGAEVFCETQRLEEKLREELWELHDTRWKAPCRDCFTVSTQVIG